MADLADGQRALNRIIDRLEGSGDLSEAYARLVLEQARRNAASKPTPQSRMAAEGMILQGANILSPAGGASQEVAMGSEFGSTIYRQFGPRRQKGYWLLPATEDPDVLGKADQAIEQVMQSVIRGVPGG